MPCKYLIEDSISLFIARGETWGYGVCDTPQNMNYLDWQGESSGLAGQSKILIKLNDRIYRPKFYRYWSKNKGFTHVLTGICMEYFFDS